MLSESRWMAPMRPWCADGPVLATSELVKMRTTQSDCGTIWQVRTYPSASSSSVIASSGTYSPSSYRPDSQ